MEKVIRDGKVAVLYSPGYGAGWYTWSSDHPEIVFHPKLVAIAEGVDPQPEDMEEFIAKEVLSHKEDNYVYTGGWSTISIMWVEVGQQFIINEYDGHESIQYLDKIEHLTA